MRQHAIPLSRHRTLLVGTIGYSIFGILLIIQTSFFFWGGLCGPLVLVYKCRFRVQRSAAWSDWGVQLLQQQVHLLRRAVPGSWQAVCRSKELPVLCCLQLALPAPDDRVDCGCWLLPDSQVLEELWLCLPQLPPLPHDCRRYLLACLPGPCLACMLESLVCHPLPSQADLLQPAVRSMCQQTAGQHSA